MANQATTTYKVTGTPKAVSNLWNTLQRMEVNSRNTVFPAMKDFGSLTHPKPLFLHTVAATEVDT